MGILSKYYKNKTILVTGGAGSIGSELVRSLLSFHPRSVRVFDNNETALFELGRELSKHSLRLLLGDIRDKGRVVRAMENVEIVFHTAALKHVILCEQNPFEAVKTNVEGTQNVIDAALAEKVEKVIGISSDKAVSPVNVMGATKMLAERLLLSTSYYKGSHRTLFSCVRFGNVLSSRGSVVPIFRSQIQAGNSVTVTDAKMKRYVMKMQDAVECILQACYLARGDEIFVFKMSQLGIVDLAKVLIEEFAPRYGYKPKDIGIEFIGRRSFEKISEQLVSANEYEHTSERNNLLIIRPNLRSHSRRSGIKTIPEYAQDSPLLDKTEIRRLILSLDI